MSKITNDGLTLSGTGCFIAVPIWQKVGVEGLTGQHTADWTITSCSDVGGNVIGYRYSPDIDRSRSAAIYLLKSQSSAQS